MSMMCYNFILLSLHKIIRIGAVKNRFLCRPYALSGIKIIISLTDNGIYRETNS